MHVLLLQLYSHRPTPDYDEIASQLRGLGHVVWVGTPTEEQSIQWHDGTGIVAVQEAEPTQGKGPIARRLARLAMLRRVRRFIREVEPDIVQINTFSLFRLIPLGVSGKTRFIFDMRQINEAHGTGFFGRIAAGLRNKSRLIDARLTFDRTTFLHEAGAQKVLGDNWRRWASVVPMGVSPHFLSAERSPDDDGAAGRPVEFIYIGSLGRIRRLERVIEAAALVRQQTDQFRVVFLGHDRSDGFYPDLIRRLKLDDRVCIHPPVPYDQVPKTTLAHDVALAYVPEMPLDWQYHPTLKILEYRALGMPIIASDSAPNRAMVQPRVNGLLVENSAASLADAMLRYINDRALLERNRQEAQRARQGLTWAEVTTQYLDLYHRLLNASQRETKI